MKKRISNWSVLIVIAAALWAVDGVIRRSLYVLSPLIIVFFEHFVGSLILAPIVLRNLKTEKLSKKEWIAICIVALFSSLLGTLWFTTALLMTNYISFSVVFLLQKLQPLFAIGMAYIVLKEKMSKKNLLWALLALVSAYFITFPKGAVNLSTGDKTITAALFALGAAAAWGSSTAFSRYILLKHNDIFITGVRFWIATIFALIGVFIFRQQAQLYTVTWTHMSQFLFIALSTGMVALLIYYKGLKNTPVHIATILELTFPLLAICIDVYVYKTSLSMTQIGASGLLLYAMYKIGSVQKV